MLSLFLNGDFTIEGSFYLPALSASKFVPFDFGDSLLNGNLTGLCLNVSGAIPGSQTMQVIPNYSGGAGFWANAGATNLATLAAGVWYNFAIVRQGSTGTLYVNGAQVGVQATNWSLPVSPLAPQQLGIGYSPTITYASNPGYVGSFRISQGALYTSSYTPAPLPFPAPQHPGGYNFLGIMNRRSYEFVSQYLMDTQGGTAPPKYYAELNQGSWVTAPMPDQAYSIAVRGIFNPVLLGDDSGSTNLAGIAAAAHTVTVTAMTLTASPFIYLAAGLSPSQLWLYSAGNMSANSFVIVGLDTDGNAQTETISGPSAGSVQTIGIYSQITSITPALTDAVNLVSAGWSQDNSTWLSSRFGDLLFWCCMSEACQFNKRWTAAKVADAMIDVRLPFAQMITRSLKRNDFDSLYSGRQNVGAPGAVPLPVPPQTAQAQGQ